jgi:hypothetical protein
MTYSSSIAQVQATAIYASKLNLPVWKYHFAHLTPTAAAYLGISHGSELPFVSAAIGTKFPGEVADQGKLMNAYWSSCKSMTIYAEILTKEYFLIVIVTGDPNKLLNATAPNWPQYSISNHTQIKFSNGTAYTEPDDIRRNATYFWRSIPDVLMH